jgi:hypothetical protein
MITWNFKHLKINVMHHTNLKRTKNIIILIDIEKAFHKTSTFIHHKSSQQTRNGKKISYSSIIHNSQRAEATH